MTVDQEAHVGVFLRRALEFTLAGCVLLIGVGLLLFEGAWQHPLYHLLNSIAPQRFWGTWFTMLGTTRCIVLVINGFWPLSPLARLSLATTTLVTAWLPLTAAYLAYLRLFLLDGSSGGFVPGLVLIGVAVMTEALCMYALAALKEARKRVG